MLRNTGSQTWRVYAYNNTTGAAVTGDAANITAKISIDGGTLTTTDDANPTETELGYYLFTMIKAETNGAMLDLYPDSSTSNVVVKGTPESLVTIQPYKVKAGITYNASGDKAQISAWLVDSQTEDKIDLLTLDSTPTLSVTLREHGSGTVLFTATGDQTDVNDSVIEIEEATPGFTDNVLYEMEVTLNENSNDHVGSFPVPIFGAS